MPELLGRAQGLRERHPRIGHAREDVVAGAVQDPEHPRMRSPASPSRSAAMIGMPPPTEPSKRSWHPRSRAQRQRRAAVGDELLVRRHDRFAGVEGALHPRPRGLRAAHQLDHDVCRRRQHLVDVVGPPDARGDPVDALAGDVRLKMRVSSTPGGGCSARMRATDRPTVPNPSSATRRRGPASEHESEGTLVIA